LGGKSAAFIPPSTFQGGCARGLEDRAKGIVERRLFVTSEADEQSLKLNAPGRLQARLWAIISG
jgi:hypothetical protein